MRMTPGCPGDELPLWADFFVLEEMYLIQCFSTKLSGNAINHTCFDGHTKV